MIKDVVVIDAGRIVDWASFHAVFAEGMGFPEFYGRNMTEFAARCPEQFAALIDAVAFVNWRRIDRGEPAVLALSFDRSLPDRRRVSASDLRAETL